MSSNLERSQSEDSIDSTGKKKSFKRLCVRFAEKTSMQGVPYINAARLAISKVMWTIMFIVAIGVMVGHLVYLCDQFFSWPKITKLTLEFSKLELPELTICNTNIIKKSQLHLASPRLRNYVQGLDPANIIKQTNKRKKRFVSELRNFNFSAYDDYDYESNYDNADGLGPPNEMIQAEQTFRELYMQEPRKVRVAMGHNISDMLLDCSFNGRQCYAENFTLYNTADHGNCYTLPSKKYVTTQSGPTKGLQMIFYMENEEYLDGVNQGYGARVSLRDNGQIPFPADDGFFVSSYSEVDIGLKLVQIIRLGFPYGTCEDGSSFESRYRRKYSRQACQKMWEQTVIIRRCGCFNEEFAEIYRLAASSFQNLRPCRSNTEQKCLAQRQAELNGRTTVPDCDNPCTENVYVRQLSSRQWPTEAYSTMLLQSVCEKDQSKCGIMRGYDKRQLSLNFVKLLVYYEDLNYEVIKEEAEIENAQFASDVGGAVGLWIGLSMLSLFEVVQLLVECCDYGRHKCVKSGERKERRKEKRRRDDIERRQTYVDNSLDRGRNQKYVDNSLEFGNRKDNFGFQGNDYDHLKHNGFRENMYNPPPLGFRTSQQQKNNDYQSVDDYYIYKGSQRI